MNKIGIIDSGVGGLTVVSAIQRLLPFESICYVSDNVNVPFGNKSADEILALTARMLDYLKDQNVKIVAIACNTISALADRLNHNYPFPILDIVYPTAVKIAKSGEKSVAITGTAFTIQSEAYQRLIRERNATIAITTQASTTLASLIDTGRTQDPETESEVSSIIESLRDKGLLENLILGCTHYPIVANLFQESAPSVHLIDPAISLADKVKAYLKYTDSLNASGDGDLEIHTTGDGQVFYDLADPLGLVNIKNVEQITLP